MAASYRNQLRLIGLGNLIYLRIQFISLQRRSEPLGETPSWGRSTASRRWKRLDCLGVHPRSCWNMLVSNLKSMGRSYLALLDYGTSNDWGQLVERTYTGCV